MALKTPYFKAFGPLLFGSRPKTAVEKLRSLQSLEDLYAIFGDLLPNKLLERKEKGANSRTRSLPPSVTFWAFLAQVLDVKGSCRETARKIEAWWRWSQWRSSPTVTASAYCQARARLDLATLRVIRQQTAWQLERNTSRDESVLGGRPVKIVDGTMLSMSDEACLQKRWPQSSGQKPGCGFPLLKLVGLFSLSSGGLLAEATGSLHEHESQLFKALWKELEKGDVILEDRGFCSYEALALLKLRGVDTVARLHQGRSADMRQGRALGPGDRLVRWKKPAQRPAGCSPESWERLPEYLEVRLIRLEVKVPGFRSRTVTLVTTLTDSELYEADTIRQLYGQRWNVELHFAQLKTILGLDVLSCKSPDMIEKELQVHLIAYNLVRALMQRAALLHHQPLARMSFKGALDTFRQWSPVIYSLSKFPAKQTALINQMLERIASDLLPLRPERSEPRARKRRPKNYQLLTKPRNQMKTPAHRNRPNKNHPKTPLS